MATQGTQVPKYTKHTLFLYFSDFSIFFNLKKKSKAKTETHKQKHVNKAQHKTRLTQKQKRKTHK